MSLSGAVSHPRRVFSGLGLVALLLALTQIILSGSHGRPRRAVGVEILLGHDGDAAVFAHLDDIEAARRTLEHPMLGFELGQDALDRALDAERLVAADALERRFLLEHTHGSGS